MAGNMQGKLVFMDYLWYEFQVRFFWNRTEHTCIDEDITKWCVNEVISDYYLDQATSVEFEQLIVISYTLSIHLYVPIHYGAKNICVEIFALFIH